MKAAIAMAKVKLVPVIVVRYAFSGDNHSDAMNNLSDMWNLLQAEGLENQVNYGHGFEKRIFLAS